MKKKTIINIVLLFATLSSYATGQEGEIIYINGEQWELLGKPVYADSILSRELNDALPKGRGVVTSNWAGYTAYWSIKEEQLCLDSILYEIHDTYPKSRTECVPSDVLLRIFGRYVDGKRIVAKWFNGDIRVAKGKMIYYVHSGFERNYENEQVISLDHGKVTDSKTFQNYVVEGFSFDHFKPGSHAVLREMFPLHIENYPELADVKRIVFSIKRARVDAQGHLVECEVRVLIPKDADCNPRLAAEMAEAMKAYHPWRVSYINGEYRAYGIEKYTFPYILDK